MHHFHKKIENKHTPNTHTHKHTHPTHTNTHTQHKHTHPTQTPPPNKHTHPTHTNTHTQHKITIYSMVLLVEKTNALFIYLQIGKLLSTPNHYYVRIYIYQYQKMNKFQEFIVNAIRIA